MPLMNVAKCSCGKFRSKNNVCKTCTSKARKAEVPNVRTDTGLFGNINRMPEDNDGRLPMKSSILPSVRAVKFL